MDEQDDKNVSDAGAWDQSRHTLNPSEQSNAAREADQDDITMQTLQALCDQVDLDNRMNECLNDLLTPFRSKLAPVMIRFPLYFPSIRPIRL